MVMTMLSKQEETLDDEIRVLLTYARGANKRKHILQAVQLTPRNCNQLAQELKSDWWTIQKHLQQLMKSNLVKEISFGRIKFYKMTPRGEMALKLVTSKSLNENNLDIV